MLAVAALLAVAAPARADTVTDWNTNAINALLNPPIAEDRQTPPVSTIHLAMVHGAVYDAVNAIDRRYEPYLGAPPARRWYSKDAAAATAAYRVLASLPKAQLQTLEGLYLTSLAPIPPGRAKEGGIAVGEAAAAAMIAARMNDGRFGEFRFTPGAEPNQPGYQPGAWRPTPPAFVNDPNAWVALVKLS